MGVALACAPVFLYSKRTFSRLVASMQKVQHGQIMCWLRQYFADMQESELSRQFSKRQIWWWQGWQKWNFLYRL